MRVTALNSYPVKSYARTALETATLDQRGIVREREFMLVDAGVIGPNRNGSGGRVTFCVEVDDLAAYLARAEMFGGPTAVPPTEIAEFGLTWLRLRRPWR